MTDRLSHSLRSDARDNRDRVLDAARALFAAEGLDVPMREVARRAGVGAATLYRRFPTKESLVTEAFTDQMRACQVIVDEGLADPDPWRGFRRTVERIFEVHALDRGFTDAFVSAYPNAMDFRADRERTLRAVAELTRRAKATGHLRPDVSLDDLLLMFQANRGLRAASSAARVAASRRFAGFVVQAFRNVGDAAPPTP